jgi:biotin operon repressor
MLGREGTRMPNNAMLVPEPGNQWGRDKEIAPYLVIPAWWRRFIFHILNPRSITVYLYLCSLMDPNAICYPSLDQIAEDLGLTKQPIRDAIAELEEKGFIIAGAEPYNGRVLGKRVIYQRPAPQSTIKKLITAGIIDGDLFPTHIKTRDAKVVKSSQDVVAAGLKRLLGPDYFAAYDLQEEPGLRKTAMLLALDARLDDLKKTIAQTANAPKREKALPNFDNLPESLRVLAEAATQIPF